MSLRLALEATRRKAGGQRLVSNASLKGPAGATITTAIARDIESTDLHTVNHIPWEKHQRHSGRSRPAGFLAAVHGSWCRFRRNGGKYLGFSRRQKLSGADGSDLAANLALPLYSLVRRIHPQAAHS